MLNNLVKLIIFNIFCHEILPDDAGRALFMKNWKIYSRKICRVLAIKAALDSFRRISNTWPTNVSQNRRMVSCRQRCTVCNSRLLHEDNQLRFSNSKHFRFYWTKKHFISEWYFTKNHEIGSRVVRKVKKSWDSRQNRELALRPAWESKSNIADVFVIFIAWTSQKASKVHTVSKLAIVLIWNIQSPHEDNISSCQRYKISQHNARSALLDRGTGTIDLL